MSTLPLERGAAESSHGEEYHEEVLVASVLETVVCLVLEGEAYLVQSSALISSGAQSEY